MSVLITMQVGPVDWEKFRSAVQWADGKRAPGYISRKVYRAEDDPARVLLIEEWESHEAFHKSSDEMGDEFNRRAGTEGLEWVDHSWVSA